MKLTENNELIEDVAINLYKTQIGELLRVCWEGLPDLDKEDYRFMALRALKVVEKYAESK